MIINKTLTIIFEDEDIDRFKRILEVANKNIAGHEFRTDSGGFVGVDGKDKIESLLHELWVNVL